MRTGWITARDGDAANPLAAAPVEATRRQSTIAASNVPGQFWSQTGDEALLCLETFLAQQSLAPSISPHLIRPCTKLRCAH